MIYRRILALLLAGSLVVTCCADAPTTTPSSSNASTGQSAFKRFVDSNCLDCHDKTTATAGLALDDLIAADVGQNLEAWEKVVRKLTARQMPPHEAPRPAEDEYDEAVSWLASSLDAGAAAPPPPGSTETIRPVNRTE
jgi:hypothetical protein